MKGTGCLENIFIDSIKHNRVFNPYTAGTKVETYHSDKQEDKTSYQQIKGVSASRNMTNGEQDHGIGYEFPETEGMESSHKGQSSELRPRSGCPNCRPERLGINQ